MKYKLTNLVITKGTNKQGEYVWMRVELENESDIFANAFNSNRPSMNIFDQDLIKQYFMPYAEPNAERPGTFKVNEESVKKAMEEGKCPDILHMNNVFSVTMPLPQPYGRIYRADVKDTATGAIVHKKGDWVIPEGQTTPTAITQLTLNVRMCIDNETGERSYPANGSPDRILRNTLETMYRPIPTSDAATADAPIPPVESAGDDATAEALATIATA